MTELAEAIANVRMPIRMRKLPISDRGFPIPAFVAWLGADGKTYVPEGTSGALRDFRIINHDYMARCYRLSRCWICGEPLGRFRVFAIGPMCAVTRVTMEPPSHRDCAEYAAQACPFMVRPRMRRNDKDMPEHRMIPGLHLDRNPAAYCLWQTETYHRFDAHGSGMLCRLGEPQRVDWWSEARPATRAEVEKSIEEGFPALMDVAIREGREAVADLIRCRTAVMRWLPEDDNALRREHQGSR